MDPVRQDARTFKTLHEIAVAIGTAGDFEDLARRVARHASDLLEADGAVLQVWDERAGVVRDVSGYDAGPNVFPDTLRLGEGIAGQTALRREVLVVEDYRNWEHALPIGVTIGVRSALSAPLLVGDRLIGVLTAHFYCPPRFVHQKAEVLALLAAQLAPAVDAAQLYKARVSLYERERLLREMSRSLASDLDEAHVLELAARHVSELVAAPYTRIWLAQPDGSLRCGAAVGYESENLGFTLPAESLAGTALRSDQTIFVDDVSTRPTWSDRPFLERTNLRPYLAVPIHRADASFGVVVAMRQGDAIFREDDERLLAGLADAIAVALTNARTLARLADSEQRLRAIFEAIACGVLVQLPVHELKVDRSFVRDVSASQSDRAIVRSIVELAHNLGLQVVAEGVEDEATWQLLGGLGCDTAQGFHLSPPLPADLFERWLMSERAAA